MTSVLRVTPSCRAEDCMVYREPARSKERKRPIRVLDFNSNESHATHSQHDHIYMGLPAARRVQTIGKWTTIKRSRVVGMSELIFNQPRRVNDRTTLARINDQEIYHIPGSILSRCRLVSALPQFLPTMKTNSVSVTVSAVQTTLTSSGRKMV